MGATSDVTFVEELNGHASDAPDGFTGATPAVTVSAKRSILFAESDAAPHSMTEAREVRVVGQRTHAAEDTALVPDGSPLCGIVK